MRGVVVALLLGGCGRGPVDPLPGKAGGPCYDNDTCDDGLFCGPGRECISEAVFTCEGVNCSGHGTCTLATGRPTCTCDSGFRAYGLACVPCATPGCAGTSGCPDEMVWVSFGADGTCVDRYEASLFANADCSGTRYGISGVPDLPPGFPANVECLRCDTSRVQFTRVAPTVEVYACSVPGLRPAEWVSWLQAARACENAGKTLCDAFELAAACGGPNGWELPYGEDVIACACNHDPCGDSEAAVTASYAGCEGGFFGLFDMLGNVAEWTATFTVTDQPDIHGGSYLDTDAICGSPYFGPVAVEGYRAIGFRCCRRP